MQSITKLVPEKKKKKKGKIETALESRRLNKVCKFQFQEQEKEIYQITDPI